MTTLMELKPREAGKLATQPRFSFEEAKSSMQDRTRCGSPCCFANTESIVTTHTNNG
jgi:hypothetical protein